MDRPEAHLEASSRGKMCAILPADYVQFEPAANSSHLGGPNELVVFSRIVDGVPEETKDATGALGEIVVPLLVGHEPSVGLRFSHAVTPTCRDRPASARGAQRRPARSEPQPRLDL